MSKNRKKIPDKDHIKEATESAFEKLRNYNANSMRSSHQTTKGLTLSEGIGTRKVYTSGSQISGSIQTGAFLDTRESRDDFSKDMENYTLKTQLWTVGKLDKLKDYFEKYLKEIKEEIKDIKIDFGKIHTKVKIFITLFLTLITLFVAGFAFLYSKIDYMKPTEDNGTEIILKKESTKVND